MVKVRASVKSLKPYVPGKSIEETAMEFGLRAEQIIKLGSNENPLGASPKAMEAIKENVENVRLYPDADATELRDALSSYVKHPSRNIVAGNGADGVIDNLMKIFIENGDEVVIPTPTFSYYEIIAVIMGGKPRFVARDKKFGVPIRKLLSALTKKTRMIVLCSPNNPTGNQMSEDDVRTVAEKAKGCMVLVDEAYVEFASFSVTKLVREYENLISVRSFSKVFGLAGMRVGYAVVPDWLTPIYNKVSIPFSVNRLAVVAGVAALKDKEHIRRTVKLVREGREFLIKNIPFKVFPSSANFVFVDVAPLKSKEVCTELLKKGIIVRDCSSFRGAGDHYVRISVGVREQNERVVDAMKALRS
jgi:histidinol-phosphate aminotransferase